MLKKLYSILTKQERLMASWLTILTIFALLFEVFGLAMIFPVISLLLDEEFTTNNYILIEINNLMESSGLKDSPLKLLMIIISVYVTKTFFQLIITFQQKVIVTTLIKNLSNKLFSSYINQDYDYFTKNNKSRMVQFLQTEMVYFFNFFESLMGLIAEVVILIGIYTIILIIEPRGVLILTIAYIVFGFIYYKILNHRIKIWGNLRLKIDQTLSKLILETFSVIKEIILNNKYSSFTKIFESENKIKSKYSSFQLTANQLPRIYFEMVALISIISFIFLLIYIDTDTTSIIFILAILAAASFKLLPSANKVITYYQAVSYYSSSFNKIYQEIKELDYQPKDVITTEKLAFNKEIEFKNVKYKYSGKNNIFNDLNLKINKGDIVGISGKSGVGKSTFINLLTGLINPDSGKIYIDGKNIQINKQQFQKNISYVSQNIFLMDESIKKNIAFELDDKLIDDKKVESCLKMVDLWSWVCDQKDNINTSVGEGGIKISGGQKHRIGIASALYKDPAILIFDEPTAALDRETENEIMSSIYNLSENQNKTIVIVSHNMSLLNHCKKVYEIKKGNIYLK